MGVANSVHLVSDPIEMNTEEKRVETTVVAVAPVTSLHGVGTGSIGTGSIGTTTELPSAKWHIIQAKSVVDSHSQDELINEIRSLMATGAKRIAIDLRQNRFLSLPAIKACVEAAQRLATKEKNFALISCQERTKRHFEIYGSLKHIHVTRYESDLNL